VSPSALRKVHIQSDLTATAIEDVACEMGVDTSDLIVFCSRDNSVHSMRIARELDCTIVLVPNEIMNGRDAWAAHHKQRHEFGMWSEGA
jgi:hypothetical protein